MTTFFQPVVIQRYFTAQMTRHWATMVELFAQNAVVIDEGQTRRGSSEIRAWRENISYAYEYTTEVRNIDAVGEGQYIARVHLEGNFPGGQADLQYQFDIENDLIQRLEITQGTE
jgi:hypothetical protein